MTSGTSITSVISQSIIDRLTKDDIVIALMGATGAGKSTFINTFSGSNLAVGRGLESETKEVEPVRFTHEGRNIVLIDTPGFDDTHTSDTDILRDIAKWLELGYESGRLLNGIIYLHRISDNRVGGISFKNMRLFHALCGRKAMKNVVLCTTMWENVDSTLAEAREEDLLAKFWNTMTTQGARAARHYGTHQSALAIINELLDLPPIPLDIQVSLAEGRSLAETAAGKWIDRELVAMQAKHKQEMEDLKKEWKEASQFHDQETQAQLSAELERLKAEVARRQLEQERLSDSLGEEIKALKDALLKAQKWCVIA
ncbi:hypothetical protein FRC03_001224 [Tulasnella sp. 419]|nr:hypothetical protein FRC02_003729 [Tulasnella sp. 418]KAG8947015.1 hypothetical protein FRC03_001224 [Tulasnella sp. 419]